MSTDLYRHFNEKGDLLYVGISINALSRLYSHKRNSHWYGEISSLTIQHFANEKAAQEAEIVAIKSEGPMWNLKHAGCLDLDSFRERAKRREEEKDRLYKKDHEYLLNLLSRKDKEYHELRCEHISLLQKHGYVKVFA